MQLGELPSPESQFSVYFAHVAPDQCSMRLDLDKARAWVVIQEKKQPQRCGQPVACSVDPRASGLAHSLLQPACRR